MPRYKLRALDLFCKAGGSTRGLQAAGFHVTGVDNRPQPRYCGDQFHQADAMAFPLAGYDFIWASPPCQRYTQMLNHGLTPREKHPDLIAPVRKRLKAADVPYCIENVSGAAKLLHGPVMLCGEMFGLRVIRHRFFECSFPLVAMQHRPHRPEGGRRKQQDGGYYCRVYGHETAKRDWGAAMGIDWMRTPELAEAIPPAYSEFIGDWAVETIEGKSPVRAINAEI
jgi:hypothetical protein